jgi:hypothetical protein
MFIYTRAKIGRDRQARRVLQQITDSGDRGNARGLACWFESLAVAQFTRRGGRPLQRRLAENELDFLFIVSRS